MPQAMAKSNSKIHPTGVKLSPTGSSAAVAQTASHVVPEKPQTAPMATSITSNGLHTHRILHQELADGGATSARLQNRPLVYFGVMGLTEEQRASWEENGFFTERGFADRAITDAMVDRIIEIARADAAGQQRSDLFITLDKTKENPPTPEVGASKVFRVMRAEPVFYEFATDPRLLSMMGDLIGPDVDCFLSQFIFKHPGTLGQPWHQDGYYFRMTPLPQVGVWLACTAATMDNGPLWIVPGSHTEPIRDMPPSTKTGPRCCAAATQCRRLPTQCPSSTENQGRSSHRSRYCSTSMGMPTSWATGV